MIESLTIKNLILIEELSLKFEGGFSVFTGETGSGKSALLNAIRLLLGERADPALIRKGCEMGVVIGTFFNHGKPLTIQREIFASGKSKSYINNESVSLQQVKEVGKDLIEIADQGAAFILRDEALHQKYFDLYGGIDTSVGATLFHAIQEDRRALDDLKRQLQIKEAEIIHLERSSAEIEEYYLSEEEEKELFDTFALLSKSQERKELTQEFLENLPTLKPSVQQLQKLSSLDPALEKESEILYKLLLELSEVQHALNGYLNQIELNPDKLEKIDERLAKMARLKKKYGDPLQVLQDNKERLETLKHLDGKISQLEERLREKEAKCDLFFKGISEKRKKLKGKFEKEIEQDLRTLNIPTARFSVEMEPKERSATGDENLYFLLAPNMGEKLIRVKDQISGGEMARLLLTLLALIASKEKKPLIVFDEIDANIGGQTALSIGQKFLQLASSRQVIAITHFPQVAIAANHHFLIHKINQNNRTFTTVQKLQVKDIKIELQRMRGE